MAMPTWKDTGPNFGSSNAAMQNAQRGFTQAGASAESIVDRYEKEEQNKIANARAQEQLDLQKQQYADQQAAKAAGSKYMADLGSVLESGVVSQADQAKLAAISQNQAISPEERARQIDAMLPKMSDAYQKDTAGQLKLLQGVQASPLLDTRDKVALLGSLADPLEKRVERDATHGYRMAELDQAQKNALAVEAMHNKNALAVEALHNTNALARLNKEMELKLDATMFYDPQKNQYLYGKDVAKLPDDQRSGFKPLDVFKTDLEAAKLAMQQVNAVWNEDTRTYMPVPEGTPGSRLVSKDLVMPHGGGSSANGSSKTLEGTNKEREALIATFTNIGTGTQTAARDKILAATQTMNAQGVPQQIQADIINKALITAGEHSYMPWRADIFNSDAFMDAVSTDVKGYYESGTYKGVPGGIPTKKQLEMYQNELNRVATTGNKNSTTSTVNKDTIVPPKQEGTWKEATPQDAADLKTLKDQLAYTSSPDKKSSLQRQIALLEIKLANGGSYDRVLAAPTNHWLAD